MGSIATGVFLSLFSLPFLLAGLVLSLVGINTALEWWDSRSWEPAEAHVVSFTREGRNLRAVVEYSYAWKGAEFRSDRPWFNDDFRTDSTYTQPLENAWQNGEPITVLVNPRNPTRAVVTRDSGTASLRLPAFGLAFAMAGFATLGAGAWMLFVALRRTRRRRRFPDQPWREEPRWDSLDVKSDALPQLALAWVVPVAMTVFLVPFTAFLFLDDTPGLVAVVLGVFAIALVLLWIQAVRATIARLRRGTTVLMLRQIPIEPGARFEAFLAFSRGAPEPSELTLRCERTVTTRQGRRTFVDGHVLWKHVEQVNESAWHLSLGGRGARVSIEIPDDQPPTLRADTGERVTWTLELRTKGPLGTRESWEIPVFLSARSELVEFRTAPLPM